MQDAVPKVLTIQSADEGEEKPKNRAVVMLDTEGCIILTMISVQYSCMYINAVFGPLGYM